MSDGVGLVRYGTPVGVTGGVDYVLSVYTQANSVTRYCYLEVRWRDASGSLLGAEESEPVRNALDKPTRLTLRVKAPAQAVTAVLLFGAMGQANGETHSWDGVQWERGQIVTAYGPRPGEILPGTITTPMIAVGAIDASRISPGSITTDLLAPGAVGNASVGENAITTRELAEGAVLAENIFANSVTADKIAANAVTARVIAAEAVVAGSIAANAVTAAAIAADAVTADKIAANAITAGKLAAGSVTTLNLVAGSVQADQIAASAITADKMRANSITAQNGALAYGAIGEAVIQDGVIGTAKIKDAAIIGAKILDGTIGTAHIGNAAINDAKIGSVSVTKLTAGYLVADVTLAARIMTGSSGSRVMINGNGIYAYDIYGSETVAIRSSGYSTFKGRIEASDMVASAFRTQEYGSRVELRGDQYGSYDAIRWYNDYNYLVAELRGFMGDANRADGLHINGTCQIGNTQSVIYQVGRRDTNHPNSRTRAGLYQNLGTGGSSPGYISFGNPFPSGAIPVVNYVIHHSPGGAPVYGILGRVDSYGFELYFAQGSSFVFAQRQVSWSAEWYF